MHSTISETHQQKETFFFCFVMNISILKKDEAGKVLECNKT